MAVFRWLHLTDLHLGMQGQSHLWPNVRDAFFQDLEHVHGLSGPWHAVLFTGDFTQKGTEEEFVRLDALLDELWQHLGNLGSRPVLLAVPGNHDLQRPDLEQAGPTRAAARLLLKWGLNPELHEEFWTEAGSEGRQVVAEAFGSYLQWWHGSNPPKPSAIREGLLPGDFVATCDGDGLRIGIAGLNTTFLQLASGDFTGRLACDPRQLHESCGGDLPRWAAGHDACLLLTHQPPTWLDDISKSKAYPNINPAGRFVVHLFGHLHNSILRGESLGGGPQRRLWQGSSVFGLEHYGEHLREKRIHGYGAGVLELRSKDFLLRHFPRQAQLDESGCRFVPDHQSCILEPDGGTRETIDRRSQRRIGSSRGKRKKVLTPSRGPEALGPYVEAAWRFCDIVDLAGLPEGERHLAMQRFLLRQLFVPLRLQMEADANDNPRTDPLAFFEEGRSARHLAAAGRAGRQFLERSLRRVSVGERLSTARRLVVLGDPGAGKTTLLRWMATAYLMRRSRDPDLERLPEADSLPAEDWLPILVRCRELETGGLRTCTLNSILLQSLAKAELDEKQAQSLSRLLRELLKSGKALLLVDGLDEITNPTLRAAFCRRLETIVENYPDAPMVVTSRIVGYREMRVRLRGFDHGTLTDLTADDKEVFVHRWCEVTEPVERRARVEEELISALRSSDRISRLTGNPMLLTTLALVKRKVGKLPTRRAKLYEEAVQVLLNWRAEIDEPIEAEEALPQLEYLAYEMCSRGEQRLRREEVLGLLEAMRREFPNIRPITRRAPEELLRLLELRTGLLVEMGAVRHQGRMVPVYEFRHLTFQEYLAALALVEGRYPNLDRSRNLSERLAPLAGQTTESSESGEEEVTESWREPLRLVVACANDHDVDGALQAILNPLPSEDSTTTARPRAILAASCLADEPNVSQAVAHEIMAAFARQIRDRDGDMAPLTAADRAAIEVGKSEWAEPLRAQLVREFLCRDFWDRASPGALSVTIKDIWTAPKDQGADETLLKWVEQLGASEEQAVGAALVVMAWAYESAHAFRRYQLNFDWKTTPPFFVPLGIVQSLFQLLNESPAVSHAASWALGWLAWRDDREGLLALWQPNVAELADLLERIRAPDLDPETFYWLSFFQKTYQAEAARESALRRLTDSHWRARLGAVEILGAARDSQKILPLIGALADSAPRVRAAAARALGRSGALEAIEPLIESLLDIETRGEAASALILLGKPGIPFLKRSLNRGEAELRKTVVEVLAGIRGDEVDAKLLSEDLDGMEPWLDPREPISEARINAGEEKLSIPASEIRRRYESLRGELGLVLRWAGGASSSVRGGSGKRSR